MVRAIVTVLVLAVLAGCGAQQEGAPAAEHRDGEARSAPARVVDPVLQPALSGEQPVAAADAEGLARQLVVSESTVRDPEASADLVAAGGRTAQVAYRAWAERPDWDAAVLTAVPEHLREQVSTALAAGRELRGMATRLPDTLPAWRIVEPLPVPELRGYYAEAQQRFGVPWQVLAAVHLVETGTGRIVGTSTAGAQGPMQFLPATWQRYGLGGDVWNTRDAILGAANYLAANGGADGTEAGLDRALFRYNNHVRYVRAVRAYAAVMQADERAFLGFHARNVYYRTTRGDIVLPVGYEEHRTVPVEEWLARPR